MEPDAAVRTVGRVSARGELGANAAVVAGPRALHAPHGPVVPHNHARNAVGRTIEGDTRHTRIIRGEEKVPRMSCGVEVRGVGIILGGERLLIVRFLC